MADAEHLSGPAAEETFTRASSMSGRDGLQLAGCTPEPLMAYLKALGILRLVGERKDESARGWWHEDLFHLSSKVLFPDASNHTEMEEALVGYFLREYRPTPLVAPWNAGSGFYLKWDERKADFKERKASEALSRIESSKANRLQAYRDQLSAIKQALERKATPVDPARQIAELRANGRRERWSGKKTNEQVKKLLDGQMLFSVDGSIRAIGKIDKDKLLGDTRSSLLADEALRWIDAAFVIRAGQKKERTEAPLLGSGGNIGNSDFSVRFIQLLASCIPFEDSEKPTEESRQLLRSSLFGEPVPGLLGEAVDQFDPGRAGGANMHHGISAKPRLNPWDYILMLEGALALQSASSRRLGAATVGSSFPFSTIESTPAGFSSAGRDTTRGEQWLPLWNRACTAPEIQALLAEGRSEIGSKRPRAGVEFARAVASLGVDRGITEFVRIQYQARFGDNYLANTLGRVVPVQREAVALLNEIDSWLDQFRRACAAGREKDEAPKRVLSKLFSIDSKVFEFCRFGGAHLFQEIVIALGHAERELAVTEGQFKKKIVNPIPPLSHGWIDQSDDGSVEFSVARALASIADPERKVGPLRTNLEPVDWKKRCKAWAEKDRSVVWNAAGLMVNLASVLQRRAMDGERAGCEGLPIDSRFSAPLAVVASFLDCALDEERIEQLLWGLMLVEQKNGETIGSDIAKRTGQSVPALLPRDYALLKLVFLPRPLVPERVGGSVRWRLARRLEGGRIESGLVVRFEPRILPLLRTGRIGEACRIAAQRLRSSGLPPMPGPVHGVVRDSTWGESSVAATDARRGARLAAALLVPISSPSVNHLVALISHDQSAAAESFASSLQGELE